MSETKSMATLVRLDMAVPPSASRDRFNLSFCACVKMLAIKPEEDAGTAAALAPAA
jgi:hypothetical protein